MRQRQVALFVSRHVLSAWAGLDVNNGFYKTECALINIGISSAFDTVWLY